MQETVILLVIGLLAGALSGILGIGGGILVIPALVMALGFSQKTAQGTSLALLLLPIGILAVYNYHKAGYVNSKAALIMAVTFMLGSYLSSQFVVSMNEVLVKKVFAVFLFIFGLKLFFNK